LLTNQYINIIIVNSAYYIFTDFITLRHLTELQNMYDELKEICKNKMSPVTLHVDEYSKTKIIIKLRMKNFYYQDTVILGKIFNIFPDFLFVKVR